MSNQILLTLPGDERANIVDYSTRVTLAQNFVIYRPGQPIEHVYFLDSGFVSLLATGRDGRAVEIALVGPEGLVGSSVVLGPPEANGGAVVRLTGEALRAPVAPFLRSCERSPALRTLVNRHVGLVLSQAEQNAFCHALHSIEARFCRWVLQVSDNSGSDVLELTQELCAQALGVQRTSVSMIAHALQLAGSIRTRRGKIEILDRLSLQNAACECYEQLRQHHAAYLKAA
jgi:CRP-like cAMP-binding protein